MGRITSYDQNGHMVATFDKGAYEKEVLCARIDELCIENEKLRAEVEQFIHAQDIGTCHEVEDDDTGFIVCSECGAVHDDSYTNYYCWCCGRKVVH